MWEQFILHAVLGLLHAVVKNPAKKAALEHQFLLIADSIYEEYGMPTPTNGKQKLT